MPESKKEISSQSVPSADYRLVEASLTNLWKNAAENYEGKEALTRVSVLNLVVFTREESIKQRAESLVEAITGHPPLRAIFVQIDQKAERDYLDAYVSVSCRLPTEGEKQLCGEKITLTAGGKGVEKISHGLLPLLEPDLPVFLFWPGEMPLDCESFHRLAVICNRLVIDSRDFLYPSTVLLDHWIKENAARVFVSDLNWARLTPWREWVAEFFDPPQNRRYLPAINRVVFEVTGNTEKMIAPYFLMGWLSSILDWELAGKGAHGFTFHKKKGGPPVEVKIHYLSPSENQENELVGLRLESDSPAMKLDISLRKKHTCVFQMRESEGNEKKCHEMSLKIPDETNLLSEELQLLKRDRVYEESLAQAASLC